VQVNCLNLIFWQSVALRYQFVFTTGLRLNGVSVE